MILIVDDDPVQRRLLEATVRRLGHEVGLAASGEEGLAKLTGEGAAGIEAVILDLVMPGLGGLGVLEALREREIATPVIVQTASGGVETVVNAMRAGAFDFVVKPASAERLGVALRNALRVGALEDEVRRLGSKRAGQLSFKDLATRSPEMARVVRLGERAAKSSIPVLLEGESGVGKELVARAIQGSGDRRGKPFVTVNCGAIPDNLVESILFGHEKGAFTGATERHAGKFVEANGGTLFLDEVGELPPEAQAKLLRAVQEGEVDPVGGRKTVRVDVRLISATNRDLLAEVKRGRFREDLYYRLNVFPIGIPPLRQRLEDVPDLARRFLARFAAEEGSRARGFSADAMTLLRAHDWPGNVRQLENAVFRAVVLCEGDELTLADFPQVLAARPQTVETVAPDLGTVDGQVAALQAVAAHAFAPPPARPDPPEVIRVEVRDPHVARLLDDHGEVRRMEDLEAEIVRFALDHYRGRMTEVARRLGIGRSTLYRRLKELGIEGAEGEADAA